MTTGQELAEAPRGPDGQSRAPGRPAGGRTIARCRLGLARSCKPGGAGAGPDYRPADIGSTAPRVAGDLLELQGRVEKPARAHARATWRCWWRGNRCPSAYSVAQLDRTGCYSQPPYVAAAVYRHKPAGAAAGSRPVHCVTPQENQSPHCGPSAPARPRSGALTRCPSWCGSGGTPTACASRCAWKWTELLATYGDGIYTVSLWGHVVGTADAPCWGSMRSWWESAPICGNAAGRRL